MNNGIRFEKTGKYRRTKGKGIEPIEINTFWWNSLDKHKYLPHPKHRRVSFVPRLQFADEGLPVNLPNHNHT
ncbi:MAG: hypothetical protein IMW92_06235 [Bacillales bacterium]|nr:hypothetical protein [Bacillales bacterium]